MSRLHQFGPKILPGAFLLGYVLTAAKIWKGDILVTDIEELEQMDASEIHARRPNAQEMLTPMSGEKLKSPIADGMVILSGGDQVLRTSTFVRDSPDRRRTRQSSVRIRRIFFNPTMWRRSTSENTHLDPGSSRTRRGTRSSSRRIRRALFSNPFQDDSKMDDAEARNDF